MRRLIFILLIFLAITLVLYQNDKTTKQITGSATGTSYISFRILSDCNIFLREGWNLISICSNMTNKTVQAALKDIAGEYRYVLEWNESDQEFNVFSPLAVENSFTELSENKSYFVYLFSLNSSINGGGKKFDDMEIPLIYGWNSPIYPYEFETSVPDYLTSINNSYSYVMVWNASSQRFLVFSSLAPENEFNTISSGEGQFIYITNKSGAILKYNRSQLE